MKKSLLALILAVALVTPVFAQKGDMSVDAKLGFGVSNNIKIYEYNDDVSDNLKLKMPISLGAEFFYGIFDNLSVGAGINYIFDTQVKADIGNKWKVGTTNIYLAVKPEAKIDSEIFSSMYLIGQLGLSMVRASTFDEDIDPGIYLGLGIGTVIKDFIIVELVLSSSNGSVSYPVQTIDAQYTATTLNIGYKFSL